MTINDADFINNVKFSDFLHHLRTCKPTHYSSSEDEPAIAEAFRDRDFVYFSSTVWPAILVIDLCINFVEKFASYKANEDINVDEVFFASMPIAIFSKDEESKDRTLIWANGMVTLTEDNELWLFLEKNLVNKLEQNVG
jgi:hypothetical protein